MKTKYSIYLICSLLLINIAGNGQIIDDYLANPISVRILSGYKFNPLVPTNTFQNWIIPSPHAYLVNSSGAPDANLNVNPKYVKWKNVEASAYIDSCVLQVQYTDYLGVTQYVTRTVGPFNLTFKTVTFAGGSSRNIPCYATAPVTITLDNYVNTDNNYPFDKNEWITRHFEWTLPAGWQTTTGQTGTFVGLSSIVVIPPSSNSTVSFSVRAKANTQYSQPSTLQITRNLESFSIQGASTATCSSVQRYTAPATTTGVTYSWLLPPGWTGVTNQNYIDVTVTGSSGSITCTMSGCGQSKTASKAVTVNIVEPGTAISGPSSTVVCPYGFTFSVSNPPPVDSIIWSTGPYLTVYSGQNTNSTLIKSSGSGNSWVSVRLVTACGSVTLPQKNVWAGKPEIYSQTPLAFYPNGGYNNVCNFQNFTTNMVVNGATNVTWERIAANPGNTSWSQSGNNISFYFWAVNQTAVYRISASNVCGTTSYDFGFKSINCSTDPCATDYLVSPNPTSSGLITIVPNIPPPCDTYLSEPSIQEISIYDNNGTLKRTEKYGKKTGSAEINTSDLLSGVYVVVIDDGKNKVRKTIIVKK